VISAVGLMCGNAFGNAAIGVIITNTKEKLTLLIVNLFLNK